LPETLAFVVPWYGAGAVGGAESECRATARALAARGVAVEILTTCARSHDADWSDHHAPGLSEEEGLPVRRFRVRPRDRGRFAQLRQRLQLGGSLTPWEEDEFIENSIHSSDLYAYLAAGRDRYWYAFIPYCFGTTWEGALVAPERSLLIPCLHDEPFAYFRATRRVLESVRHVAFHVPAERALGERLAGAPGTFALVGEGVDPIPAADPARFRRRHRIGEPFLLYVGRKVREKNVPLLMEYFARYRLTHPDRSVRLVLIGSGQLRIPERLSADILDLGVQPAEDKFDAYAAALAVCQPSRLESFSLVLMEAWLSGTPALVDGHCAVTREHCLASNGGLFFDDYFEFAEAVDRLLDEPGLRRRLAERGRVYVLANYTWDRVTERYLALLRALGARLG
jgi:glycosyltransferase involved in cell wall biosynthesis